MNSLELQLLRTGESLLMVWRDEQAEFLQRLTAESTLWMLKAIAHGVKCAIVMPHDDEKTA